MLAKALAASGSALTALSSTTALLVLLQHCTWWCASNNQHLVMLQRCARQWLRVAKQGQYAQDPGQGKVQQAPAPAPGLSHQSSASKAAMQVQQQQLAALEAEQRLLSFCQATEGSSAEAIRQHQHQAKPISKAASAAPVMGGYAAQQVIQQPKRSKQQVRRCLY